MSNLNGIQGHPELNSLVMEAMASCETDALVSSAVQSSTNMVELLDKLEIIENTNQGQHLVGPITAIRDALNQGVSLTELQTSFQTRL